MAKLKMNLPGYDWNDSLGKLELKKGGIDIEMPFSNPDDENSNGLPITLGAFTKIIKMFYDAQTGRAQEGEAVSPFKDIQYFDVSKASMFRILSQEGCEYIRFHLCIPDKDENVSLALEGMQIDKTPILFEKVLQAFENPEAIADTDAQVPFLDEKVHGGGKGVYSMAAQIQQFLQTERITEPTITEFATRYLYEQK